MSKVWLITGSGNGLGRDIAEAALAAGDSVVAGARRTEDAFSCLDELMARKRGKPRFCGSSSIADFRHDHQIIRVGMKNLLDQLVRDARTIEIARVDVIHARRNRIAPQPLRQYSQEDPTRPGQQVASRHSPSCTGSATYREVLMYRRASFVYSSTSSITLLPQPDPRDKRCLVRSRSQHQLAARVAQFDLSERFAHVVESKNSGDRHFQLTPCDEVGQLGKHRRGRRIRAAF